MDTEEVDYQRAEGSTHLPSRKACNMAVKIRMQKGTCSQSASRREACAHLRSVDALCERSVRLRRAAARINRIAEDHVVSATEDAQLGRADTLCHALTHKAPLAAPAAVQQVCPSEANLGTTSVVPNEE